MTQHDFKIWLVTNRFTQRQIAERFGVTEQTLVNYGNRNRYPRWFPLALRGLVL